MRSTPIMAFRNGSGAIQITPIDPHKFQSSELRISAGFFRTVFFAAAWAQGMSAAGASRHASAGDDRRFCE
jgi:hypothetical protein